MQGLLSDAEEKVGIVCDKSVLVNRQFSLEARAIQTLEEKESLGQACVRLRLGLYREIRSRDPGHSKLLTLPYLHLAAPQGKAVR